MTLPCFLFQLRRLSDIGVPVSANAAEVDDISDKKRKEWRRQATAVLNNSKFHKAVTKLLAVRQVFCCFDPISLHAKAKRFLKNGLTSVRSCLDGE
jgi:hypothetical protein